MMLLRQKQETNVIVKLTDAMAKFVPLLDTTRLRANFRRAGLQWTVATFVFMSLGVAVPVQYGYLLKNGLANDLSNHYHSLHAMPLAYLRFNVGK